MGTLGLGNGQTMEVEFGDSGAYQRLMVREPYNNAQLNLMQAEEDINAAGFRFEPILETDNFSSLTVHITGSTRILVMLTCPHPDINKSEFTTLLERNQVSIEPPTPKTVEALQILARNRILEITQTQNPATE